MNVTIRMGATTNLVRIENDDSGATFDRTPLCHLNRRGRLVYSEGGKQLNRMVSDAWARGRG